MFHVFEPPRGSHRSSTATRLIPAEIVPTSPGNDPLPVQCSRCPRRKDEISAKEGHKYDDTARRVGCVRLKPTA